MESFKGLIEGVHLIGDGVKSINFNKFNGFIVHFIFYYVVILTYKRNIITKYIFKMDKSDLDVDKVIKIILLLSDYRQAPRIQRGQAGQTHQFDRSGNTRTMCQE